MKKETLNKIREEFKKCVINTINRVKINKKKRPFHDRLLSKSIIKASSFERSFSTSFGQRTIETISKIVASDFNHTEDVKCQKKTTISLGQETIASIDEHLNLLRENNLGRRPCWKQDIKDIKIDKGTIQNKYRIISDLWFLRAGVQYFFSIKTVKPNIDQTQLAKKDMLLLKSFNPHFKVYFALPYNPFGDKKEDYGHDPPFKIFNMTGDEIVLIGKEYWDLLGGQGTYEKILDIANSAGADTRPIIEQYFCS